MAQEVIYNYLKKKKKPTPVKQICIDLHMHDSKVKRSVKQMLKYNELCCVEITINNRKISAYLVKD